MTQELNSIQPRNKNKQNHFRYKQSFSFQQRDLAHKVRELNSA
jgi:hypothetical protein